QLVPPFEAAFQAHLATWRLDGKPRTARQFAVYTHCPFPTPEDRLFFLLTYLTTYSLQGVQGRLFGMRQRKAKQWMHGLLPALGAALRPLGEAPARPGGGPRPAARCLRGRRRPRGRPAGGGVGPRRHASPPPFGPCRHGTPDRPPPRPC